MTLIFGAALFAAGLIVGWNFFPQPTVVANFIAKLRGKSA